MKDDDKIIDIIISLQERGYNHDFIIEKEHIRCLQYDELISPDDFEIVETYHCECKNTIENGSLVYAITLTNYDIKGILMSTYQSYINGMSIRLWAKFHSIFRINAKTVQISKSVKKILI